MLFDFPSKLPSKKQEAVVDHETFKEHKIIGFMFYFTFTTKIIAIFSQETKLNKKKTFIIMRKTRNVQF